MKDTTRTLIFVAVAIVSLAAVGVAEYLTRPAAPAGFENEGGEFYPDFADADAARGLRVVAFDEDTATIRDFSVEYKDGRWRIPSHSDYPAEAEDRLARTAASVIGVRRTALVTRRPNDHERYGVLDPLAEGDDALKGRGKRVTLYTEDESTLADFIIGRKVEGQENAYYVRRADEDEVYRTELKIDLSTKFADWIEPDLLKLERADLAAIQTTKPDINAQSEIVGEETNRLVRDEQGFNWKLEGLEDDTLQLNDAAVRDMVSALDDLKIVGVRVKPKQITADLRLKLPPEIQRQPALAQEFARALRSELAQKGFFIIPDDEGNPRIVSREGEVTASTKNGVTYRLHFGNQFTGSLQEIEVGTAQSPGDAENAGASQPAEGESAEKPADEKGKQGERPARYLFVRVEFDESLIGDKPTEPIKPEKPEGVVEPAGAQADTPEGGEAAEKSDAQKKYEADLKAYETALADYKTKSREHEDKVEAGRKKVEELNDRFANWYYVISGESFDDLRLTRKHLVQPKTEKPESSSPGFPGGLNFPQTPPSTNPSPQPPARDTDEEPVEAPATSPADGQ